MKKHFLLLVMALMSVSAWAADLTKGSINAPSPYYGQNIDGINFKVYNEQNQELDEVDPANPANGDYIFNGYFSDAACTTQVTFEDVLAAVGTTFYIKVTGANLYEGVLTASFQIKKMPVSVTFANKQKVYLQNDPAIEITGVTDINGQAVTDQTLLAAIEASASREPGVDVKPAPAAQAQQVPAAGGNQEEDQDPYGRYSYTASLEDSHYSIGACTGGLMITPKDFIAEGNDATVGITLTGNFIYNGSEQNATVSIKDLATNEAISTDDYTVEFTNNTEAGQATATITPKRNYKADDPVAKNYTIKTAPLLVTPYAKKEYDGDDEIPQTFTAAPAENATNYFTFTYQGFVEDEEHLPVPSVSNSGETDPTYVAWRALASSDATKNANATGYNLTTCENNNGNDNGIANVDNYYIVPQPGKFVITPKKGLKVTVDNAPNIPYGAEENFTFALDNNTYVNADAQALRFALKVVKTTNAQNAKLLTVDWKSDTEIETAVNAAVDADNNIDADHKAEKKAEYKAAAIAAKANYLLEDANITKGTYSYANASMMIALKESAYTLTKVYDGTDVPAIEIDTENGLLVNPVVEGLDLSKLKVTVVDNDEVEGTATVGTYRLELSGLDEIENYDITYVPSRYVITPRPLTITLGDQTFVKGETLNLDETLYTLSTGDKKGLASTDQASEVFTVTTTVQAGNDGKVSSDAGNNYEIDAINPADALGATEQTVSKWANYDVTVVKGVATVIEATTKINTGAKIETEARANATVTIVSERVLNPEAWNAMVLPFEVSVAQLSKAFGYAIVNVLNTNTSTADHIAFSVEMKSIPENTPFLVKVVGNKAGSEYKALSLNGVTFEGVNLVAAESKTIDAFGNKFTGVYEETPITGSQYGFLYDGPATANGWYTAEGGTYKVQPLDAYLTYATAKAPLITVEDIDGTVTAIKSISTGEFQEMKAEGWYTLGGMKLQGAPTQKGVYINNGKKVVIR